LSRLAEVTADADGGGATAWTEARRDAGTRRLRGVDAAGTASGGLGRCL